MHSRIILGKKRMAPKEHVEIKLPERPCTLVLLCYSENIYILE